MPQTTPERAARWPGMDSQAIDFLRVNGYILHKDWTWTRPVNHTVTSQEEDALLYLIEEWDFGGLRN